MVEIRDVMIIKRTIINRPIVEHQDSVSKKAERLKNLLCMLK